MEGLHRVPMPPCSLPLLVLAPRLFLSIVPTGTFLQSPGNWVRKLIHPKNNAATTKSSFFKIKPLHSQYLWTSLKSEIYSINGNLGTLGKLHFHCIDRHLSLLGRAGSIPRRDKVTCYTPIWVVKKNSLAKEQCWAGINAVKKLKCPWIPSSPESEAVI